MKNSMYILGNIEATVGAVVLWLTKLTAEIMPKLGRAAYQAAAAGSYSPGNYAMDLTLPYLIGGALLMLGVGQVILAFRKKK